MNSPSAKQRVSDALMNFDQLPESANVRVDVVAGLFGVSIPSVWRMTRDGRLPQAKRISARHTAWNVGELRAVLATL